MNSFRKYGQRKDSRRAAKTVINGQLTARCGIIFECSGRDSPLDLLRQIHEEVHLQNTLEASGQIPNMANPAGTTILLQS